MMVADGWHHLMDRDGKPTGTQHMLINGRKQCNRWVTVTLATDQDPKLHQCEGCHKILRMAAARALNGARKGGRNRGLLS